MSTRPIWRSSGPDLTALASTTRQRIGNISYDAAIDDPETGRLLIAERWADQAALNAHLAAADKIAFVDRWRGLIQGDIRKLTRRTNVISWIADVFSSVISSPSQAKSPQLNFALGCD